MGKSIAVLGLGRFGSNLAEELYNLGAEIMVVDNNRDLVDSFSGKAEVAVCADLGNEDEIKALGLGNMDIVVVAMGTSPAPSALCVMIAKEEGVERVLAKATSERMAKILLRVGADEIVDPERETGFSYARMLTSKTMQTVLGEDENLCMVEMKPKKAWVGKTLASLNLRQKYNINVVAVRREGSLMWAFVDPYREIAATTQLLVAVDKKTLKELE